jgi:hypothetical protein
MKLIPMTDFVLEQYEQFKKDGNPQRIVTISRYANFLKQPLSLDMFVPCDDEGNFLTEPKENDYKDETGFVNNAYFIELHDYSKAKERILIDNVIVEKREISDIEKAYKVSLRGYFIYGERYFNGKIQSKEMRQGTVEKLIGYAFLNETAIKQIFR